MFGNKTPTTSLIQKRRNKTTLSQSISNTKKFSKPKCKRKMIRKNERK